ncbi:hypothetical protein V5799_033297 [Amblyomma americanum]|uniref:Uncharacterized protein n=1 Tax=Amblyomma americanum TaxID=6943 RepID=A0AAQ4DNQ5_AMBAM
MPLVKIWNADHSLTPLTAANKPAAANNYSKRSCLLGISMLPLSFFVTGPNLMKQFSAMLWLNFLWMRGSSLYAKLCPEQKLPSQVKHKYKQAVLVAQSTENSDCISTRCRDTFKQLLEQTHHAFPLQRGESWSDMLHEK